MTVWQFRNFIQSKDVLRDMDSWKRLSAPFFLHQVADILSILFTAYDGQNRGHTFAIDIDGVTLQVVGPPRGPLFGPTSGPGFDQDGVVGLCLLPRGGLHATLFYTGFEVQSEGSYSMFLGAVDSLDNGLTFDDKSRRQVLFPSDEGNLFRAGGVVRKTRTGYEMLYAAGSKFELINGRMRPTFRLFRQVSLDIEHWHDAGDLLVDLNETDYGYGRPWFDISEDVDHSGVYFSVRNRATGGYRAGFGTLDEKGGFKRNDGFVRYAGLPNEHFGSEQCYASTFVAVDRKLLLLNGSDFGSSGFAICERVN